MRHAATERSQSDRNGRLDDPFTTVLCHTTHSDRTIPVRLQWLPGCLQDTWPQRGHIQIAMATWMVPSRLCSVIRTATVRSKSDRNGRLDGPFTTVPCNSTHANRTVPVRLHWQPGSSPWNRACHTTHVHNQPAGRPDDPCETVPYNTTDRTV